jgi:hypothetical protein
MAKSITSGFEVVRGVDLGDKKSVACVIEMASGEVVEESQIRTTPAGMRRRFGGVGRMRIAIELGARVCGGG